MEYEYDGEYLTMRGNGTYRQIRLSPDEMLDVCAAFAKWSKNHALAQADDATSY